MSWPVSPLFDYRTCLRKSSLGIAFQASAGEDSCWCSSFRIFHNEAQCILPLIPQVSICLIAARHTWSSDAVRLHSWIILLTSRQLDRLLLVSIAITTGAFAQTAVRCRWMLPEVARCRWGVVLGIVNCIELVSVRYEIVRKFWRFGLIQSFVYETGRFEEFSRLLAVRIRFSSLTPTWS